jgi:hypothetical protein
VERYNRTIKSLTIQFMQRYDLQKNWPKALELATEFYNFYRKVSCVILLTCACFLRPHMFFWEFFERSTSRCKTSRATFSSAAR